MATFGIGGKVLVVRTAISATKLQPSERLASLGFMGDPIEGTPETARTS